MNNGKHVVLVVEDSAIIRMGSVDMLRSVGYLALEAGNADEALGILQSRDDVDLVFTDVEMKGPMDGLMLCNHVHQHWPLVRLVVISGNKIRAKNNLPDGILFFDKPYVEQAVLDGVARLLSGSLF